MRCTPKVAFSHKPQALLYYVQCFCGIFSHNSIMPVNQSKIDLLHLLFLQAFIKWHAAFQLVMPYGKENVLIEAALIIHFQHVFKITHRKGNGTHSCFIEEKTEYSWCYLFSLYIHPNMEQHISSHAPACSVRNYSNPPELRRPLGSPVR